MVGLGHHVGSSLHFVGDGALGTLPVQSPLPFFLLLPGAHGGIVDLAGGCAESYWNLLIGRARHALWILAERLPGRRVVLPKDDIMSVVGIVRVAELVAGVPTGPVLDEGLCVVGRGRHGLRRHTRILNSFHYIL